MDEIPHPTPGYDQGRSHIWTAETIPYWLWHLHMWFPTWV